MKYSLDERMRIGREIHEKVIGLDAAAVKYGINVYTVRDYYRHYKATLDKPPDEVAMQSRYALLSRQELVDEIMELRVEKLLAEGVPPREVVHRLRDDFQIKKLCAACGITNSMYDTWRKKQGL